MKSRAQFELLFPVRTLALDSAGMDPNQSDPEESISANVLRDGGQIRYTGRSFTEDEREHGFATRNGRIFMVPVMFGAHNYIRNGPLKFAKDLHIFVYIPNRNTYGPLRLRHYQVNARNTDDPDPNGRYSVSINVPMDIYPPTRRVQGFDFDGFPAPGIPHKVRPNTYWRRWHFPGGRRPGLETDFRALKIRNRVREVRNERRARDDVGGWEVYRQTEVPPLRRADQLPQVPLPEKVRNEDGEWGYWFTGLNYPHGTHYEVENPGLDEKNALEEEIEDQHGFMHRMRPGRFRIRESGNVWVPWTEKYDATGARTTHLSTIDMGLESSSRRERRLNRYGGPIPHLGSFRGEIGYQRDIVPVGTESNRFYPPLLEGHPVTADLIPLSRTPPVEAPPPFRERVARIRAARARAKQAEEDAARYPTPEGPRRLLPWPARAPTATVSRPPPSSPPGRTRSPSSSSSDA